MVQHTGSEDKNIEAFMVSRRVKVKIRVPPSIDFLRLLKKNKVVEKMGFLVKAGFLLLAAMSILSMLQIGGSSRVPVFIESKIERGRVAAEETIYCSQKGCTVDSVSSSRLIENFMYKFSSGPSRKGPGN